jgi:hypothetical protein
VAAPDLGGHLVAAPVGVEVLEDQLDRNLLPGIDEGQEVVSSRRGSCRRRPACSETSKRPTAPAATHPLEAPFGVEAVGNLGASEAADGPAATTLPLG